MTPYFVVNLIIFIAINAIISMTWLTILYKKIGFNILESIAGTFLFSIGQIVLSELFLGIIIKQLYSIQLIILNILFAIFLITLFKLDRHAFINVLVELRNLARRFLSLFKAKDPVFIFSFIIFLFSFLNILTLILVQPTSSWDDYGYHLNFLADIIHSGSIRYFPPTHTYTISYPHDMELLNLWNIIFFRNDFLAEIVNLGFLFYGSLIVYLSCRRFNVSKNKSIYSAFIPFFIPINLLLIKTTKVDLALAVLFFGAIYFLLSIKIKENQNLSKKSIFAMILSSLSISLIFGSKPSGLSYVAVFVVTLLIMIYKLKINFSIKTKFFFKFSALLAMLCSLFGLFWYVRSWDIYNNPLYPLEFKVLDHKFPGEWKDLDFQENTPQLKPKNRLEKLVYVWQERDGWYGVFYLSESKLNGFGSLWYVLLLPSLLFTLILALIKKKYKLILFLFSSILCFWTIPGNWITHYTTILIFLSAFTYGYFLDKYIRNKFIYFLISIIFLVLSLINVTVVINNGIFELKDTLSRVVEKDEKSFPNSTLFKDSNLLLNKTLDKGDIVVAGDRVYFPYALIKSNFETQVITLPFTSDAEWLQEVEETNPRFIMATKKSLELKSMQSHPELFELIYIESDGPHYLFIYKKNNKNTLQSFEIIKSESFNTELCKEKPVLEKYEVIKKYGVYNLNIKICKPETLELITPTIFLQLTDSEGILHYLDYIPQDITKNNYFGEKSIPIRVGDSFELRFGLFDSTASKFYTDNSAYIK